MNSRMELLPRELRELIARDLRPKEADMWHHTDPYPEGFYEGLHPEYINLKKGVPSHVPSGRPIPDTWHYGPAWKHKPVNVKDFSGMASVAEYTDRDGRKWELVRPWDRVLHPNGTALGVHHPIEGSTFWRLVDPKTAADVASVCYTRSCQVPRPAPPPPPPVLIPPPATDDDDEDEEYSLADFRSALFGR